MPMATRPEGPIELLSKADFNPKEKPTNRATMAMRFSQRPPITVSRSLVSEAFPCDVCRGGGAKPLPENEGATSRGLAVGSGGVEGRAGEAPGIGTDGTGGDSGGPEGFASRGGAARTA